MTPSTSKTPVTKTKDGKVYQDNDTVLAFPLCTFELWFMLTGLKHYVKTIRTVPEEPDYKLLMIGTAMKAIRKAEAWLKERNCRVASHSDTDIAEMKAELDRLGKHNLAKLKREQAAGRIPSPTGRSAP